MGTRFNGVPLWNIKSHIVTINSRVLHSLMKEVSPVFDVHEEEFSKVTSRGADFRAFREFMEAQAAHDCEMWKWSRKPRRARQHVNLYCGKQRAFTNFFNQLSVLKVVKSQRIVISYGAGRFVPGRRSAPAPSTRANKECAYLFIPFPIDEFRTSYVHHELRCAFQRIELEKCQQSPEQIEKYCALTEVQMERRAKVRRLLALESTINGKKRTEFVNRLFHAVITIMRCAVLETRPEELTRTISVGQPLKVALYGEKLKPVVAGRSKKAGRRLHVGGRRIVYVGRFAARHHSTPVMQRTPTETQSLLCHTIL